MAAKKRTWQHLKTSGINGSGVATNLFTITMADGEASSTVRGQWAGHIADNQGTPDRQNASGWFSWTAVRKGAAVTVNFAYGSDVPTSSSDGADSYTFTWAATTSGTGFTVAFTPTIVWSGGATTSAHSVYVRFDSLFPVEVTLL